jgi:hypothetical protein
MKNLGEKPWGKLGTRTEHDFIVVGSVTLRGHAFSSWPYGGPVSSATLSRGATWASHRAPDRSATKVNVGALAAEKLFEKLRHGLEARSRQAHLAKLALGLATPAILSEFIHQESDLRQREAGVLGELHDGQVGQRCVIEYAAPREASDRREQPLLLVETDRRRGQPRRSRQLPDSHEKTS